MMADLLLLALVRAQAAASAAILVVLALRPFARRLIGPELAYRCWTLVPVAAATSLFPTLQDFLTERSAGPLEFPAMAGASLVLTLYAWGVAALALVFGFSEWRFRVMARRGRAGPAVVGVAWPRIVLPSDYEQRFDSAERRLIRKHEQTHIARKDPRDNLVIAVAQALGWFNPLVHLAARAARLDQELACDAAVVDALPEGRRLYAETLLKAHGMGPASPLACALAGVGRHPLEVRLRALRQPSLSVREYVVGAALLGSLGLTVAVAVWGLAPQTTQAEKSVPRYFVGKGEYRP
jgi:beta-lactamase regulating signal transducer with metallopeptidase domain